ncbi:CPBP family intramembrane metalloprotease [bacterium]|nr:CPBP family intramembrane metalloprotease [bacterium]
MTTKQNYLDKQIPDNKELWFIFKIIGIYTALILSVAFLTAFWGNSLNRPLPIQIYSAFHYLFVAAEEEAFYRFVPLVLAVEYWGTGEKTMVVIIISSLIFGFIHGSYVSLIIASLLGFLLSIVFLKLGGSKKKYLKPYVAIVIIHAMINFSITNGTINVSEFVKTFF